MSWRANLDRVKSEVDVGLLDSQEWARGVGLSVGGMGEETQTIIEWVRMALALRYLLHGVETDWSDQALSQGLVLVGPHGSGKSTLARSVAFEHGIFTSERRSGSTLMARRHRGGRRPDGPEVPGVYNANGAIVMSCRTLSALSEDDDAVRNTLNAAADAIFRAFNKRSESRTALGLRYFNLVLLVLDDVDALDSKTSDAVDNFCKQVRYFPHVALAVLATSNSWDAVPEALKSYFEALNDEGKIFLKPLSPSRRLEVLSFFTETRGLDISQEAGEGLADMTHGFLASDLMSLCQEIDVCSDFGAKPIDDHMLEECVRSIRDLLYQRNSVESSFTLWSGGGAYVPLDAPVEGGANGPGIGLVGLEEQLLRLHLFIVCALEPSTLSGSGAKGPQSLKDAAAVISKRRGAGCILYGPAGTGKSALIRFTARQCRDCNVISLDASSMISKLAGQTEINISAAFEDAKSRTPCLIIIDRLESLAGIGGGHDELRCERRAICIARELDDLVEFNTSNMRKSRETGEYAGCVKVLASTNRIEDIHPLVSRACRLDDHVLVPLPGPTQLTEMLEFYLQNSGVEPCEMHGPTENERACLLCLSDLAQKRCQGFSGADIQNVVREAGILALRRSNLTATHIAWRDIHDAVDEQTRRFR